MWTSRLLILVVHGERAFDAACSDFVDWEDALCYQS